MAGSSNSHAFFEAVVGKGNLDLSPADLGIIADNEVKLYTWDAGTNKPIHVGKALAEPVPGVVPEPGARQVLRFSLHGHTIEKSMVSLRTFEFVPTDGEEKSNMLRAIPYPYSFHTTDEVPDTLGRLFDIKGSFLWDQRAMLPMDKNPAIDKDTRSANEVSVLKDTAKVTDSVNALSEQVQALNTAVVNLLDEEEQEEENLKKSDDSGRTFKRKEMDMTQYATFRMRIKISQIRDFNTPLRDRNERHVQELVDTFTDERIGYQPNEGTMTVTVLDQDVKDRKDLGKLVAFGSQQQLYTYPDSEMVTIVDGRHRREAITRITKMTGTRFDWSRDYIEVLFQYRIDMTIMSDWEVLMLSSHKNQVASLVYEANTVNDVLRSIQSYSIVFQEAYQLSYFQAKTTLIKDDMTKTRFLGALPDSTITRYIRCSKAFLRNEKVKKFLFETCTVTSEKRGNQANLSFVTEPLLLQADEHSMLLMLRCADAFYRGRKRDRFFAKPFYQMCSYAIDQLKITFQEVVVTDSVLEVPPTKPTTFESFLVTPVQHSSSQSVPPIMTLQNTLQTFKYNPADEGKGAFSQIKRSLTVLRTKILKHYGVEKKKNPVVPEAGDKRNSDILDLTKSPEPPTKKRRTRRNRLDPALLIDLTGGDKGSNTKKTKKPKNNKGKGKGNDASTSLRAQGSAQETKEQTFDDSLDLKTVPSGYEDAWKTMQEFDTDGELCLEEILMMRRFPYARSKDDEQKTIEVRSITVPDSTSDTLMKKIVDPSLYLRAICIPQNHRAHLFVTFSSINLYRNLACAWAVFKEGFKPHGVHSTTNLQNASVKEQWETTMADMTRDNQSYHSTVLGTSFFEQRKLEMDQKGYTILEDMADPLGMIPHLSRQEVGVASAEDIPTMTNGEWFLAIEKLFPGENVLRDPTRRTEWNSIYNTGDTSHHTRKNNVGAARYQSTNHFVTNVLETPEYVELAHKRAHLDVWIGMLASFLSLDGISSDSQIESVEQLVLPVTGGRLLFTGRLADAQIGHNDFHLRDILALCGYFVIMTGTEQANIYLMEHSHKYVFLPEDAKKGILENLAMTKITIPATSVFFGHGYLHHAGSEYDGSGALRYHAYLRPETVDIQDAIHFNHAGMSAEIKEGGSGVRMVTRSNNTKGGVTNPDTVTAQSNAKQDSKAPNDESDDDDMEDDEDDEVEDGMEVDPDFEYNLKTVGEV